MRLKLQGFRFKVKYRQGKFNPADYTSRQPLPASQSDREDRKASKELEFHVHWVVEGDVPPPLTLDNISKETLKDPVLSRLYNNLQRGVGGGKADSDLQPYQQVVNELSIAHGVILRGQKIVLPTSLHKKAISIAHEGHQGVVKTKQLLRSRVWFPGLEKKVQSYIDGCIPCQATVNTTTQEPVKSTELPNGPWESLAIDYYGPMPSGEYILVVIDEYSRFPEIDITTSTSAKATLPKLDRMMSSFGIPLCIKTDNGPPFTSKNFEEYCQYMGIEHHFITPRHPRANGLVENFNRMIKKVTRTATIERKPWKREIYTFLRSYRATPHITTGQSPASLLFQQRQYRVRLPELPPPPLQDKSMRDRDACQKLKAKQYADQKQYVKVSQILLGDKVLLRNERKGKLIPNYDPQPYVVSSKKGSTLTAVQECTGKVVTRDTSWFKKLKVTNAVSDSDSEESSEEPMLVTLEADGEDQVLREEEREEVVGNGEDQGEGTRSTRVRKPPTWHSDYLVGEESID